MDAHKTQIKNTKMNELNGWNCTLFWLAQKLIKVIMAQNPKSKIQIFIKYLDYALSIISHIARIYPLSTIIHHRIGAQDIKIFSIGAGPCVYYLLFAVYLCNFY